MTELDEIITGSAAVLFCKGQDWKPGDGTAFEVDKVADQEKQEIKDLMLKLIGEEEAYSELREKVQQL